MANNFHLHVLKILFVLFFVFVYRFSFYTTTALYTDVSEQENSTFASTDWTPPPVPTLLLPPNNSFLNSAGFTLDWTDEVDDLSNPVYYLYQSSSDSGFGSFVTESGSLGSSSFIDINIVTDGEYWWRVRACDQLDNCSAWTGAWKLTLDTTLPTVPGQIGWTSENPPVGSDYGGGSDFDNYRTCGGSLNYSPMSNLWEPSTDATAIVYERQVFSPNDSTLIYTSPLISSNFQNGGGAVNGQTYWARVRTKDAANNYSAWTGKCAITYDTSAPIISGLSHLVGTPEESNDTIVTITWTTNENADSVLYWSTDGFTWSPPISDPTAVTSHSLVITGLTTNTTYYYYVTSTDPAANTATSGTNSFDTSDMTPEDFTPTSDIVINEFLIDPIGADNAAMPGGEWVELYNNSTTLSYDLTGWSISAYNTPTYRLMLTTTNTTSSDPSTSGLTIGPNEFFVVYRNGNSSFFMRNIADDRIRLFNASNVRVDRYMYTAAQVIENKSIARYPDGSATWFDPIPSPLGNNILEPWQLAEPEIAYTFDSQRMSFEVKNVDRFTGVEYQLTYNSDEGEQGVIGNSVLATQSTYKKDEIIFGTCSSGGACVYHNNVNDIILKVVLHNDTEVINLEKNIN